MSKLFTLYLFFLSVGLSAQNITGTQKIPTSALPGTEFTVETIVNKGTIKDFMKFFQEIPEGLVASEIESQGGTFTFADGGAKIVWITPPKEEVFVIKYKVTINGGVSGTKKLPAKISYINNNERKIFDFPLASIVIGTATPPVKKEIPTTNPTTTTQPAKTTPAATTPATTPVKTTPVEPKKETPTTPTQPTTFAKVPTSALPTSAGKMYRVQIGAFSSKPKIDGVTEVTVVVLENGITKYFSGNFSAYEDALKRKKEMIEKGFQGAFIVSFENGKIVK
ncbi:MAG: hypothetical protein IPP64_04080 [Bacteroidetes bacterium]|nr:hypothetical protein [Bacteroidota bacterium]